MDSRLQDQRTVDWRDLFLCQCAKLEKMWKMLPTCII